MRIIKPDFIKSLFDKNSTPSSSKNMQKSKPYLKYFIKSSTKNKSKTHLIHKGHLANECLIFWKSVGGKYVPILHDTNLAGSKRIWILRSHLYADMPLVQENQ